MPIMIGLRATIDKDFVKVYSVWNEESGKTVVWNITKEQAKILLTDLEYIVNSK